MATAGMGEQLQRLREAIDGLDLPVTGDAIVEARDLLDRLDAAITEAEAAYTSAGLAEVEGFANTAAFERHRCRLTLPESRRVARRAARVAAWPELGRAWRTGRVTGAQVDLVAALVPDRHLERFAETIDDTIEILRPLTTFQTGKALRHWVRTADAFAEREAAEAGIAPTDPVPELELSASRTLDDELVVSGSFDTDSAAYVEKALTVALRDDADGEVRTAKQRRADALVEVCRVYLEAVENPDGNRRRERLTVTADVVALHRAWLRGAGVRTAAQLEAFLAAHHGLGDLDRGLFLEAFDGSGGVATTLDAQPVTDSLVAGVAAGGAMELLLTAGGRILSLGRTSRTFSAVQRRAVLVRDGGCRSPGCDAGPERCDIHHVVPWDLGGMTDIDNAVAKCRRCHLDHHRKRWADRLEPDGTYVVTTGEGRELRSRPRNLEHDELRLPVATRAEAAPEPDIDRATSRPRCNCPCEEHRSPAEEARFQHDRALMLERIRLLKLERGA